MKLNLIPQLIKLHKEVLESCKTSSNYKKLLEESMEIVKQPPKRGVYHEPGIVELRDKANYLFIGDLHGDYYALLSILNTIWNQLEDSTILVFLGDYIDRGYMQIETLSLVLYLKKLMPYSIILLRGNHEPAPGLTPYPHDYIDYLREKYHKDAYKLYELSLQLFNSLPLAAIHEEHFIALHGGPPLSVLEANKWQDVFEIGNYVFSHKILEEVLWSDPIEFNVTHMPSPRGAGVLYGRKVSENMLRLIKGRHIIRGHEAVDGIRYSHEGLVVTVFSSPLVYGFNCAGLLRYYYDSGGEVHRLVEQCIKVEIFNI